MAEDTPSGHPKSLDFDVSHEAGASTMLALSNIGFGVSSAGMIDPMQQSRLLTLIVILALLTGCASTPGPLPEDTVKRYGTIAVVPARYVPDNDFIAFAEGAAAGALKGALGGAGASAYTGTSIAFDNGGASGDPLAQGLGAALITIVLLPILVPMGAIGGSQAALPSADVERLEATIHSAVERAQLHHQLASQIVQSTIHLPLVQHDISSELGPANSHDHPDYRSLNVIGVDTVLEVAINKARFKTVGKRHRDMQVELSATARMVSTADNRVMKSGTYDFESPAFPLNSWTYNGGYRMNTEFAHGFQRLTDSILNDIVEPSYWPYVESDYWPRAERGAPLTYVCGLMPLSPKFEYRRAEYKYSFIADLMGRGAVLVKDAEVLPSTVGSVEPILSWKAFPKQTDPDMAERIRDVSYDLRVWVLDGKSRGPMIYERHYLPHSTHQLENPLHPYTTYLWSVRAHYELDGRRLVTPWSYSRITREGQRILCSLDDIPEHSYLRFRTPAR